jgi:hypothetical protein
LGQQIVGRMRDLGMTTVLPGFAGHVPPAMKQLYPKANITQSPTWAGFNSTYSEWGPAVSLSLSRLHASLTVLQRAPIARSSMGNAVVLKPLLFAGG